MSSAPALDVAGTAAVLTRLKIRLLVNTFRTGAGPGMAVGWFVLAGVGVAVGAQLRSLDTPTLVAAAPTLATALFVLWTVGPLIQGATDETVDTTRLALLPLRGRRLAPGLLAAAVVGPAPVVALVVLGGFVTRTSGALAGVLAAVAALLVVLLALTGARLAQTALGGLLRDRRTRDLGTVLSTLALVGTIVGVRLLGRLDELDADRVSGLSDWARLTPPGWAGEALAAAVDGSTGRAAIGVLTAGGALVAGLWTWGLVLERALTTSPDHGAGATHRRPLLRRIPVSPRLATLAAIAAKERRYLARHPRYRSQIVSQSMVLLVGGAPFLAALVGRDPRAVALGCVPALTAGVSGSNLLGADGRALWGEALALPSLRPVLRGRSLVFVAVGLGASLALTLVAAATTGGWEWVPVALGASVGLVGAGAGVGTITSVWAPVVFPDDDAPNPFSATAPGTGVLQSLATIAGVLIGLLLAAPVLIGLAAALRGPGAAAVVTVVAPLYGIALWWGLSGWAARRVDRRLPDLVARFGT